MVVTGMARAEKRFIAQFGEPLEALTANKDYSLVAVAAGKRMKLLSIGQSKFDMVHEFRIFRKTTNVTFSISSIAWSALKDNLIAAASYGSVFLFDIENFQTVSPDQPYRQYKLHKQQLVNKICFNEFNENLFIAGLKDGTILLYDIRTPEPSLSLSNKEVAIRDLQFCFQSKMQDSFITADDNGSVRFWDIRTGRVFIDSIAHTGYASSVALNPQPQSRNLIATAGRDKFIRVWDWSKQSLEQLYTVETMAPLTHVSWCPDNIWHVASSSTSNDHNIHVWDIRRPFLPYATFNAHHEAVTDMCWPQYGMGNHFLSCGKDGQLILHHMEHAHHPFRYANSASLTCHSPFDGLIIALPEHKRSASTGSSNGGGGVNNNNSSSGIFQSQSTWECVALAASTFDQFRRNVPSSIFCAVPADICLTPTKAISCLAKGYKLSGASVEKLCQFNAQVAEHVENEQLAYVWNAIALLCRNTEFSLDNGSPHPPLLPASSIASSGRAGNAYWEFLKGSTDRNVLVADGSGVSGQVVMTIESKADDLRRGARREAADGDMATDKARGFRRSESYSEDEDDEDEDDSFSDEVNNVYGGSGRVVVTTNTSRRSRRTTLFRRRRGGNDINDDFFFGVSELNLSGMYGGSGGGMDEPLEAMLGIGDSERHGTDEFTLIGGGDYNEMLSIRRNNNNNHNNRFGNKQPFSVDVMKLRDEAFDLRGIRCDIRSGPLPPPSAPSLPVYHHHNHNEYCDDGSGMHRHRYQNNRPGSVGPNDMDSDELENDVVVEDSGGEFFSDDIVEVDLDNHHHHHLVNHEGGIIESAPSCCSSDGARSVNGNEIEVNDAYASCANIAVFWDPLPRIKSILDFFSTIGDVQMCATICQVLGNRLLESKLFKVNQVDMWFYAYLELLERLELWNVAAALIKTCYRPKINQLSNESTFVKVISASHKTPSLKATARWLIHCCVCEQVVRGVWCACVECGHGGHLGHMQQWFASFTFCPFIGCGHVCTTTTTGGGTSTQHDVTLRQSQKAYPFHITPLPKR